MSTPGTKLNNDILLAVGKRFPRTVRLWRQNAGGVMVGNQFVRFGLKGESDLQGLMAPNGRFLAIEGKAGKDRMSPAQLTFKAMIEGFGGLFIEARSAEQVVEILTREMGAEG